MMMSLFIAVTIISKLQHGSYHQCNSPLLLTGLLRSLLHVSGTVFHCMSAELHLYRLSKEDVGARSCSVCICEFCSAPVVSLGL